VRSVACKIKPQHAKERDMDKSVKIVLADDHTLLREGLRALLSAYPKFEIVGEAADGRAAVRQVEKLSPDLVMMDLSMPRMTGMDAIREIKKRYPETKVIALTVHKTEEYLRTTLQAGADAYVLKDATHDELLMAVKNVLAGKPFLSPGVSEKVIEGYLEGHDGRLPGSTLGLLSPREREVLKLIAEGYKNKEIAADLCISLKTTEKHRSNLMKKLDLHNAAALTAYAIEQGLV
jgi:two-component system response regulator NreC